MASALRHTDECTAWLRGVGKLQPVHLFQINHPGSVFSVIFIPSCTSNILSSTYFVFEPNKIPSIPPVDREHSGGTPQPEQSFVFSSIECTKGDTKVTSRPPLARTHVISHQGRTLSRITLSHSAHISQYQSDSNIISHNLESP